MNFYKAPKIKTGIWGHNNRIKLAASVGYEQPISTTQFLVEHLQEARELKVKITYDRRIGRRWIISSCYV